MARNGSCSRILIVLETRLGQAIESNAPRVAAEMSPKKKSESSAATEIVIPEKLYFRIGEVARLCRLPAYVLRFWETEFPQLKPVKSSTGQRMYRRRDVESVVRIKQLLYEDGYTIAGARQHLRETHKSDRKQEPLPFPVHATPDLGAIRQGLKEILTILAPRR
jgi:DNA-binding transcriptional MerR regulator